MRGCVGGFFRCLDAIALFLEAVFVHTHLAVVKADEGDGYDEYECQESLEVIGNGFDEELKTLAVLRIGGNRCCPA
jgi:hypothetical protein